MAFELHRKTLHTKLGLRKYDSRAKERMVWKEATKWLLLGPSGKVMDSAAQWPYDDYYHDKLWSHDKLYEDGTGPPASAPATVTHHSGNAKVEIAMAVETASEQAWSRYPAQGKGRVVLYHNKRIDYVILVSNTATGTDSHCYGGRYGASFLISDSRIARIFELLGYGGTDKSKIGARYTICPTGQAEPAQQLLWCVDYLPAQGSRALTYSLPQFGFWCVTSDPRLEVDTTRDFVGGPDEFSFEITNKANEVVENAFLEVYDSLVVGEAPLKVPGRYMLDGQVLETGRVAEVLDSPRRYRWKLPKLDGGAQVSLGYIADYEEVNS
jgi:hypothetical protein